ncbi:MAG: HAMP domain-containing protein [Chloroflexi bacterium]|nr:MAG: HAMP domain-containing protein [Chloroflexota bacterium]
MLSSLRFRLALSHFIPILVLVPLFSLALIYLLETRVALVNVANEMAVQAQLVARLTQSNWQAWKDPSQSQPLMTRLQVLVPAQIYVVDSQGRLLVASGVAATTQDVPVLSLNEELLRKALAGHASQQVRSGASFQANGVDVVVPVLNDRQEVVGAIQLSQGLGQTGSRLTLVRWLVWATAGIGMLLAGLLGFLLSRSLNRPLEQLTTAARSIRFDQKPAPVAESGPGEVRLLAHTFNGMAERLYELEQGRRRLLRSIVHELGRPLGAIKAAAHVLGQNNSSSGEVVAELAEGIDEQVDQLRLLLDDLTLLAQSEMQELALDMKQTDVGSLVQSECHRNEGKLRAKEITLSCQIAAGLPHLLVDPVRISQILGNLLDNAYKYTPTGGRVVVSAAQEGGGDDAPVVVRVRDTGPGIDPADRKNIFQFFYRAPNQTRIQEGMGIGLALARRLAEAHGGTLTVAEGDGSGAEGAEFVLRLPVGGVKRER